MPLFVPNSCFSNCWSSVGNITFYHRNGVCYWRAKSTLQFAGTPAQVKALDVHKRALAAWRTLSHQIQLEWNSYARSVVSHKPPFGEDNYITGHNLFVSAYHGFYTLENEHIPQPKAYKCFPNVSLTFKSANVVDSVGLELCFILNVSSGFTPDDYALLGKIQLVEAGRGCNPGKMKNVLASQIVPISAGVYEAVLFIENYRSFSAIDCNSYSAHIRYLLIDRNRGYRNNYKKTSATFSI